MKDLKVVRFKYIKTIREESSFIVLLNIKRKMDIPLWSFFEFILDKDPNLSEYSGKFSEWEDLTEDLISMGYDFEGKLTEYVRQFTEEEINEFAFS